MPPYTPSSRFSPRAAHSAVTGHRAQTLIASACCAVCAVVPGSAVGKNSSGSSSRQAAWCLQSFWGMGSPFGLGGCDSRLAYVVYYTHAGVGGQELSQHQQSGTQTHPQHPEQPRSLTGIHLLTGVEVENKLTRPEPGIPSDH